LLEPSILVLVASKDTRISNPRCFGADTASLIFRPGKGARVSQSAVALTDAGVCSIHFLPLVAFFLGYFPNRASLLIEKLSARKLGYKVEPYAPTPLSTLQGISYAHEVQLAREGFDNVENLCDADTLDLAVRTAFSYRQLRHWIGQAWLMTHLRPRFDNFATRTSLTTRHELQELLPDPADDAALGALIDRWAIPPAEVPPSALYGLLALVKRYEPHVTSLGGGPPDWAR
jgi:hypothetical protein